MGRMSGTAIAFCTHGHSLSQALTVSLPGQALDANVHVRQQTQVRAIEQSALTGEQAHAGQAADVEGMLTL
jgi:hypothetical protein